MPRKKCVNFLQLLFTLSSIIACTPNTALQTERESPDLAFALPEMVLIPGGNFLMGSAMDRSEQPIHEVIIRTYYISKYETTFEQYDFFTDSIGMPRRNDLGWGRGKRPVVDVSWNDAVAYTNWLSEQTGSKYRLPTESEWEYAARAGSTTEYFWGEDLGKNNANCIDCKSPWDEKGTAPVGSFLPNKFGLYDMHGNVFEWVQDCFMLNYEGAPIDGSARVDCNSPNSAVMRGGSWDTPGYSIRSAKSSGTRSRDFPFADIGVRVVKEVE